MANHLVSRLAAVPLQSLLVLLIEFVACRAESPNSGVCRSADFHGTVETMLMHLSRCTLCASRVRWSAGPWGGPSFATAGLWAPWWSSSLMKSIHLVNH